MVVSEEQVVDLRAHVDVALAEIHAPRDPLHQPVSQRDGVLEVLIAVEGHGEMLAAVRCDVHERQRMTIGISQQRGDARTKRRREIGGGIHDRQHRGRIEV